MAKQRVRSQGKHRVQKESLRKRGLPTVKAAISAVGMAGVAVAGAAAIGTAPTMSVSPQLLATLHYLRGTNIGYQPTREEYENFIGVVVNGTDAPETVEPYSKVDYNAGFKPFSRGGFGDLTFDDSVAQGVGNLKLANPAPGDVIFGFSQGAVVASQYKGSHVGNTYILVENPSRPNGGILQRFEGWHIPILDVTFSGATPNNGDNTIDVARQYDGWADFPTYLWNPLAIANALAGMVLVHGNTQLELTQADLDAAENSNNPDYYQYDINSKTKYYVVRTYPIPLLMPLDPFLPDAVIAALDAPLRKLIETAYDRSDYSKPTRATLFPQPKAPAVLESGDGQSDVVVEQQQRSAPELDVQMTEEPAPKRSPMHTRQQLRAELAEEPTLLADAESDQQGANDEVETGEKSDDPKPGDSKVDDDPTSAVSAPSEPSAAEAGGSAGDGAAAA